MTTRGSGKLYVHGHLLGRGDVGIQCRPVWLKAPQTVMPSVRLHAPEGRGFFLCLHGTGLIAGRGPELGDWGSSSLPSWMLELEDLGFALWVIADGGQPTGGRRGAEMKGHWGRPTAPWAMPCGR